MKKVTPIRWGSDPEGVSVMERDGKLYAVPPVYFRKYLGVPASKHPNHPVFLTGEGWSMMEDGAAWEMTIEPDTKPKNVFDRIQECAKAVNEKIFTQFPDHVLPVLRFLPMVGWDVQRWENEGEDFHMSTRFGCDPSKDAFDMEKRAEIVDASLHPERYCGAHVHMSGSPLFAEEPVLAIQCQAISSGLAAVRYSDVPELERARSWLYGIPGNWRLQEYGPKKFGKDYAIGIEYRTPSATWAKDWAIAEKVFQWAEIGVKNLLEGGLGLSLLPELANPACEAILNSSPGLAGELLDYIEDKL